MKPLSEMFRRAAAIFAMIALAAVAAPVHAQDAAGQDQTQTLIDVLENEEARAKLIEALKASGVAETAPAPQQEEPSLARQFADGTRDLIEQAARSFATLSEQAMRAPEAFTSLEAEQIELLIEALWALALVIIVTTAAYILLLRWSRRLSRAIGDTTHEAGFARTFAMLLATTAMEAVIVLVAWGAGYAAALFFHAEFGVIGVRQSLYLNAFLVAGLAKVVIRAVLSPATHELRFVAVSDAAARTMAGWFSAITSVLVYGQLLVVPIVNRQASMEAGRGVSTLIAFIAILAAAILVIARRRAVAAWILGEDPEGKRGLVRFAARNWHAPVLIYLAGLFFIVAARPDGLIWPVLINSAQVGAIVVAGILISGAITKFIASGVKVPSGVHQRLPALERRLNSVVPRALTVVRTLIILLVLAFVLDAIELIDIGAWLSAEFGGRAAGALAAIAGILFFSFAVWLALASWVDFRLNPDFGSIPTAREQTLLSLLKNAATIVLVVIALMFALSELGVDIAPLIASAGVLGLAIGFGSQKLVQDIITGVFIQFESAMNVGDVVTLGGTTGVVEKLTIRSVSLRDVHGTFHIIPFSSLDMVSNYMRDYGNFVCDFGIAYRENVEDGKAAMMAAFDELKAGELGEHIIDDLQWFGVQTLGDSAVILRARIKCKPGQQWAVGRAYNEICKRVMDERGIEIPFPHQTIYFGEDKQGEAPAVRVAMQKEAG